MAETDQAPGAADVTFELVGEGSISLRPSTGCILRLCRLPGGLHSEANTSTVHSRVMACDVDTMADVIRAGLGIGTNADPKLPEKIANTGVFVVRLYLDNFIAAVARGGRPIPAPKSAEDEEDGEDKSPLAQA
jgi:hypothetical protein